MSSSSRCPGRAPTQHGCVLRAVVDVYMGVGLLLVQACQECLPRPPEEVCGVMGFPARGCAGLLWVML